MQRKSWPGIPEVYVFADDMLIHLSQLEFDTSIESCGPYLETNFSSDHPSRSPLEYSAWGISVVLSMSNWYMDNCNRTGGHQSLLRE